MIYAEIPIKDLGYHIEALGGPGEIWGLDNMLTDDDDQRFRHLGFSGYPEGALMLVDNAAHTKALAVLPDGTALPSGGVEIAAADVPALLVAEYGWPQGTALVDGLPVRPQE